MKLLVITVFLFISYLYSQGLDSIRTVKLEKIDSNYVLYSENENPSLFFSKSIIDSTSFETLKDIYNKYLSRLEKTKLKTVKNKCSSCGNIGVYPIPQRELSDIQNIPPASFGACCPFCCEDMVVKNK